MNCEDLVLVHCSLVTLVIEMLPPFGQRYIIPRISLRAHTEESPEVPLLRIISGKTENADAMAMASLDTLKGR